MEKTLTQKEITELMLSEMADNDLIDIPFWWDNSKTCLGRTHYEYGDGKVTLTGISLSQSFFDGLDDKWDLVDTVYHEIAHAIAIKDHQALGHGKTWKGIAAELGAKPSKCNNKKINRRNMKYKYTAFCVCAYEHFFSRLGRHWKLGHYFCPDCGEKLEVHKNF